MLDLIAPVSSGPSIVSVLDVGCGNGRLFRCLQGRLRQPFVYFGFDSSPALIKRARQWIHGVAGAHCGVWDFTDANLPPMIGDAKFDLIMAFGVLHHLPSYIRRRMLLEMLCRTTSPLGAVAVSTWCITSEKRFAKKLVAWEEYNQKREKAIDLSQLEPGDHLVARPGQPPRYCHFIDRREEEILMRGLPLALTAAFTADGRAGHLHRYFILRPRSGSDIGSDRRPHAASATQATGTPRAGEL